MSYVPKIFSIGPIPKSFTADTLMIYTPGGITVLSVMTILVILVVVTFWPSIL